MDEEKASKLETDERFRPLIIDHRCTYPQTISAEKLSKPLVISDIPHHVGQADGLTSLFPSSPDGEVVLTIKKAKATSIDRVSYTLQETPYGTTTPSPYNWP